MENEFCRCDFFYENLDTAIRSEKGWTRPVVIVQNNIGNKFANTVIIVPLTKKIDRKVKLPTHIVIKKFKGIKYDSTALTEQVRVIDKRRLIRKVGKLQEKTIQNLNKALAIAIDIK